MFTGIITAVGRVATAKHGSASGHTLSIRAPYTGVKRGESIAVSGVCLTVERVTRGGFTVHAIDTTLERTLLGEYAAGRRVNLERAVRAMDRLGGHLVQGHVDGVALVTQEARVGDAWLFDLRPPREVRDASIVHGSITVDGVSLTINALPGPDEVQIALVPFTRAHTTLGTLRPGDRVHVEGDVIGKYVRQLCRSET